MGRKNRLLALGLAVGVLSGVGGAGASASVPTTPKQDIAPIGWHTTVQMKSKADAQKALDNYLPKIKAAGDWVTDSDVLLVNGGWMGETYYAGNKLIGDDFSATLGRDLSQLMGYHVVNGLKTQAEAQKQLNAALAELYKHPDSKDYRSGLVTIQSDSKGHVKSYGYAITYFTSNGPLFKGDPVRDYVEHDNNAGDNDD